MTDPKYRLAVGHDVALEDLLVIDPQPRSEGLAFARRTYAADGSVRQEAPYVVLMWDVLDDGDAFQALMAQFGLGMPGVLTAEVTLSGPLDAFWQDAYFNGTAVRPQPGTDAVRRDYFLRNVQVVVRDLVTIGG